MSETKHTLPLAARCLWYRQGDLGTPPVPGIVTGVMTDGRLMLSTFAPMNHNSYPQRSVRHISDPLAKTQADITKQFGLWDYADEYHRVKEKPVVAKNPESTSPGEATGDSKQIIADVLELFEQYGEGQSVEIARQMHQKTGEPWTYQRVNGIVARHRTQKEPVTA